MNCAAIPSTLIENELFGHEKGSYTGICSFARKIGKFELADQGTIFLDEIGELHISVQAKVLRVIEDQCFERIGGVETIQVNTRLVAATNRDLKEQVTRREFREDLFLSPVRGTHSHPALARTDFRRAAACAVFRG